MTHLRRRTPEKTEEGELTDEEVVPFLVDGSRVSKPHHIFDSTENEAYLKDKNTRLTMTITRRTCLITTVLIAFLLWLFLEYILYRAHYQSCYWHRGLCTPWIESFGAMEVYSDTQKSPKGEDITVLRYRNPRVPSSKTEWGNYQTLLRMNDMKSQECSTHMSVMQRLNNYHRNPAKRKSDGNDDSSYSSNQCDTPEKNAIVRAVLVIAPMRLRKSVAVYFGWSLNQDLDLDLLSSVPPLRVCDDSDFGIPHSYSNMGKTKQQNRNSMRTFFLSEAIVNAMSDDALSGLARWSRCQSVAIIYVASPLSGGVRRVKKKQHRSYHSALSTPDLSTRIRRIIGFYPFGVRYMRVDSHELSDPLTSSVVASWLGNPLPKSTPPMVTDSETQAIDAVCPSIHFGRRVSNLDLLFRCHSQFSMEN